MLKLYKPHERQLDFHRSNKQFRIVNAGRQSGKTLMVVNEVIRLIEHANEPLNVWWVAPLYELTTQAHTYFNKYFKDVIHRTSTRPLEIETKNGSVIKFKSAKTPEDLVSESVNILVVDEAGRVKEKAVYESCFPTLTATSGKCILIGTPKGDNWFYQMYKEGLLGNEESQSFKFTSYDNPYADVKLVNKMKTLIPDYVFRQEFLAEFIQNANAVFKNVDAVVTDEIQLLPKGNSHEIYTMGLDLAKEHDWTVASILNSKGELVYIYRVNKDEYTEQVDRLATIVGMFNNCKVVADNTGVGAGIIPFMKARKINVLPYTFTAKTKKDLVDRLAVAIEQRNISIPYCKDTELLVEELRHFEYEIKENSIRYSAPENKHDDCVMSLALANWGLTEISTFNVNDIIIRNDKTRYNNAYPSRVNPNLINAMRGR